jgi:hypothetical protein
MAGADAKVTMGISGGAWRLAQQDSGFVGTSIDDDRLPC